MHRRTLTLLAIVALLTSLLAMPAAAVVGVTISGTVLDGRDGARLPEIEVRVRDYDSGFDVSTWTDDAGRYEVTDVEMDRWVEIAFTDPVGQSYGAQIATEFTNGDIDDVRQLNLGGSVNGTVVDSFGDPVEGASFEAHYDTDPVLSGVDGTFALPYPLNDGLRFADILPPEGSGLLPASAEFEVVAGQETGLEIVLAWPGSMAGTVIASDSEQPLRGVEITVFGPLSDCEWCFAGGAGTDRDGAWSISELEPGEYHVLFDLWGSQYSPQWFDGADARSGAKPAIVAAGQSTAGIDASLRLSTAISGRVEASGTRVTDGIVGAYTDPADPESLVSQFHMCCGDERFDLRELPEGTYYLRFDGVGGSHWYGTTGDAADATGVVSRGGSPVTDLVIEIDGVGFLTGIMSAEGEPLGDVRAGFGVDVDSWDVAAEPTAENGRYDLAVTAGTDGFVRLEDSGTRSFYTLEPIPVHVIEGVNPLDITLEPGLGVPGNVDGFVIEGATDGSDSYGVPQLPAGEDLTFRVTGCENATYTDFWIQSRPRHQATYGEMVEGPTGTYTGTVEGGVGAGAHEIGVSLACGDEFVTGLYSPVTLTTVGLDGLPVAGVTATLSHPFKGPLAPRSAMLAPVTPSPVQTTDAEGRFGWLLRGGEFTLTLEKDGCVVEHAWLGAADDLYDNTFLVDCGPLPQDAPGVWGQVAGPEGQPLADMGVALVGYPAPSHEFTLLATTTSDADGVYGFGADWVHAGEGYRVVGFDPAESFGADSAWFGPAEDGPERRDLRLSAEAAVVVGTVSSMAGPVEGARVTGLGVPMTTSVDGAFRSIALSRGQFAFVDVAAPDGSDLYSEQVEVILDSPEVSVDVMLATPGRVSGGVSDGSGTPLQGIIVSSSAFGQVRTGPDGSYLAANVRPSGEVTVMFYDETGTYAYEWYDDATSRGDATMFEVFEGQVTSGIDARLGVAASVSGTVSAGGDSPNPINGVGIHLVTAAGSYVSDTRTAEDGTYVFGGLPAGQYVVEYYGPGGQWYSGDTGNRADAVPVELGEGGSATSDMTVPNVGFVAGSVTESGAGVAGVRVYEDYYWQEATTGTDGRYRLPVQASTSFGLEVYAGQFYDPTAAGPLMVAEGVTFSQDFSLNSTLPGGAKSPRAGTTVEGARTTSGLPTLAQGDLLEVTTTSCTGGSATFDVMQVYPGEVVVLTGKAMVEAPDGTYVGNAGPFAGGKVYEVRIHIDCPGDEPDDDSSFGLYIDPAGTIEDTNGAPIEGATATLYRSDDEGGPYTVVPDGSTIMSPANRTNPDVVGVDGVFQWLTVEGWYKVRAQKDGCTDPDSEATYVETPELPVPPEQVGLVLTLDCGEVPTGAPDTLIDSGPSGVVNSAQGTFTFSATEAPATFECMLDDAAEWTTCPSTYTTAELGQGAHTLQVRATVNGLVDATPASRTWTVDTIAPRTTMVGGPSGTVTSTSASFTIRSEPDATFECKLDTAGWTSCSSPVTFSGLEPGIHTVQMRARDTAGNEDTSPAKRTWTVEAAEPTPEPEPSFSDTSTSIFRADIAKLAQAGITKGCNPKQGNTKFCPDAFVTRGQMAAFLNRALGLPAGTKGGFSDSKGNIFEADIAALAKAGITKGCNPKQGNTKFCPDAFVTRGQMAAFLNRALPLAAGTKGRFTDSKGHLFEADIVALANAGITKGCNPKQGNAKFCPDAIVTRGQMAAFLVRAGLTD